MSLFSSEKKQMTEGWDTLEVYRIMHGVEEKARDVSLSFSHNKRLWGGLPNETGRQTKGSTSSHDV